MNAIKRIGLLFLFFIVFVPTLRSQDAYLKHYSTESGLPSSTVYSVFQQSNGFIWFCMDVGVCRFDGVNYDLFTTEDGLPGNEVFGIFEDSYNRLWFRTLNGRIGFYLDGEFYGQDQISGAEQLISGYISSITEDWNRNLILSTSKGYVLKISPDYKLDTLHLKDDLIGVYPWQEGQELFLIGAKGIYNLDPSLKLKSKVFDFSGRLFHKRAFFSEEFIYFSNGGNLERYHILTNTTEFICSLPSHIISLTNSESSLYLGTRAGLYQSSNSHPFAFNEINCDALSNNEISSVLVDAEGNSWYSTLHNGVFMAPNKNIFLVSKIRAPALSLFNLGDSVLYAGSNRGTYYQIDPSNHVIEEVVSTFNGTAEINGFGMIGENFWIFGKHVFIQVTPAGKKSYFILGGNGMTINANGDYLWSSHKEVVKIPDSLLSSYLIDHDQINNPKIFRRLGDKLLSDSSIEGIIQKRVYSSAIDPNQEKVWFASENGLVSLKTNEKIPKVFSPLSHISVKDIALVRSRDLMALATDGKGLVLIDEEKIVATINTEQGLQSNFIRCVEVDNDTLWVGTLKGVSKISLEKNGFQVTPLHFVGDRSINDISPFNSKIYIGTDNGVEYFDRNSVVEHAPPSVFITAINSNGNRVKQDGLKLPYSENNVRFEFTGLSYQNYGQVRFQYRLKGYDQTWNQTKSRMVEYKALPAGKYLFEVKTIDTNNILSVEAAQISFMVLKPFWQKWWFILSIVIVAILSTSIIWRIRMKFYRQKLILIEHEKQQIEIERNLSELEQKALRMQMNPHFIFNALNTIKGFYAEKNIVQAKKYIKVFSKLMRAILDTTSDLIPIQNEIEILELYLELSQIRYADKFFYQIEIDPTIDTENTGLPPMLFQPFVENAIIHGLVSKTSPGTIKIRFGKKDEHLKITIEDNGIGRRNSAEINKHKNYTSKATDIIEQRLWYLSQKVGKKYDLRIEDLNPSEFNTGTKVEISLPLIELV